MEALFKAISDIIADKNSTISTQKWQIELLNKEVNELKKKNEALKNENEALRTDVKMYQENESKGV